MGLWTLGFLAQASGDHDVALSAFEEARQVSESVGADLELAYALLGLGLVRMRRGEPEQALEVLQASREVALQVDDPVAQSFIVWMLATALAAVGRSAEALALAHEGLADAEPYGDTVLRGVVATVLGILQGQVGDGTSAEATLQEALRLQVRLGHRWGMVTSLDGLRWVAASSGRLERAARLHGAVASLWEELGIAPAPYWQIHRDQSEATARAGLGDADYELCFEQGRALRREDQVALALGDVLPSSPVADGTVDGAFALSARELEVARLVADGLSNPAVAAELFVSVATVKTHVSHILQKLALDSRVQLAAWVATNAPPPAT
jgi:non-specific serine/threonine protein kinase